jgi:hypothetical protein
VNVRVQVIGSTAIYHFGSYFQRSSGGFQVLPKLFLPEEKWNKNLCGKFRGEDQQLGTHVSQFPQRAS